jgi:uncharacterized protein (DUF1778 family)
MTSPGETEAGSAESQILLTDHCSHAAALRGTSVTEFVVASAQEAATAAIKDYELLTLHGEAREVFVNAILNPPAPNEAARKAARRYGQQMGR